jgi:predicted lactoylglutathione lyase
MAGLFMEPNNLMGIALVNYNPEGMKTYAQLSKGCCGKFGELAIPVANFAEAAKFWESIGFEKLSDFGAPYKWGIFYDGLMTIGLHETEDFEQPALTYFSLTAKEKIQELQEMGMEIKNAMPDVGAKEITNGVATSPDGWPVFIFHGGL